MSSFGGRCPSPEAIGFHRRLECPESWLAEAPALGRIETEGLEIAFVKPGAEAGKLACVFANCRFDWLTQIVVAGLQGSARRRRHVSDRVAELVLAHAERVDVATGLVPTIMQRCGGWGLKSVLAMAHYVPTGRITFCRTPGSPMIVFRRRAGQLCFTLGLERAGEEGGSFGRAEHRTEPGDRVFMLGSARSDWMSSGIIDRIRATLAALGQATVTETVEGVLSARCLAHMREDLTVVVAEDRRSR